MGRARQNPAVEGVWLVSDIDPHIALDRNDFGVVLDALQAVFAAYGPKLPTDFDASLHRAAKAHPEDPLVPGTRGPPQPGRMPPCQGL